MISLFSPYVPQEAIEEVSKTLNSQTITQGPKVDLLEQMFQKKFNVAYSASVNSGTSALETAYDLLGLQPGDEVITTPLTCAATNIPLLHRGVKLVWADIRKDTLCIDSDDVQRKITDKTKAIVQVHLGGVGAEVKTHLPIVSDACQALGIFSGDFTCCSFQAIKHITSADGGMVVTSTETAIKKAKLLRWFGIDRTRKVPSGWESYRTRMMSFDIELLGYKRHMNDVSATLAIEGLKQYDEILVKRRSLFDIYKRAFSQLDGITLIDGNQNVYWLCTVLVERRDDFAKMLYEKGIETNLVQVRNDIYTIFGGKRQDLPVMNEIESQYISLPLHPKLTTDDIEYIVEHVRKGW